VDGGLNILALNPGSSSLKYGFFDARTAAEPAAVQPARPPALRLGEILGSGPSPIDAVGVRVVHGGSRFESPAIVDDDVLAGIRELAELAPLHNPIAVDVIEEVRRTLNGVPIVAVFDTAFHRTLPPVAFTYAVPPELGVRRYGFHGISYSYVSKRLRTRNAGTKHIVAHLGNGASVCAIRDGRSIDTSMGFTPMEGLVMGTRGGDLDPGAILYLLRKRSDLDDLLNHRSGLRGVSETSGDVRELERAAAGDARAELALDLFAYRAAKYIASYCAALDGVDAIAFTAGIGEHSASMRSRICTRLGFLGVSLDETANTAASKDERRISSGNVEVWVIPTNEELEIARAAFEMLGPR